MSGINGDKSRFHRLRKQKIQRRMRNRVMYAQLTDGAQSAGASSEDVGRPSRQEKRRGP